MKLVDMRKLSMTQRNKLAEGLLVEAARWEVSWFDEEDGDTRYLVVKTERDARREADGMDGATVKPVTMSVATTKLSKLWKASFQSSLEDGMAEDFAVLTQLEAEGHDGAWWSDLLDPYALSAPRGVIFQSAMPRFTAKLA
jgi:hypothetical protein